MPFAGQLARKINRKSPRKSTENRSPETPRGTQNRLKIASGTLSGHPVACKSVPKASRERLGSVPERPRRAPGVPGGSPRAPRDAIKGALERPGARRGDQNRRQVASGSEKIEFFSHGSFAQAFRSDDSFHDFGQFSVFSQNAKSLFRTTPASKNRGSALRAASLDARLLQPRKTSKIDPKINPKSSKTASRGVSGALFGRLLSLEVTRSSDSGRLGATRAARRATRSDQVGRSGSVGVGRIGQGARIPRVLC